MLQSRRKFLKTAIGASVAFVVRPALAVQRTEQPEQPNSVSGMHRPRGWGLCIPAQEWAEYGDWVLDGVLAALNPACWHSWGIWPSTNAQGRVPAVFSDQYFDRAATRQYLSNHPGREWGSFNEPEITSRKKMMPSLAADDRMVPDEYMSPELAVEVTLEFIDLARSVGNDFQFMSPNVTLNTSHDGLGWLTEYMSIMRRKKMYMRPSSWGIHPYSCNSVTALRQSMEQWWAWWDVWGSNAPTVITEVCAQGEDTAGQMLVMDECAAMLRRKEVSGVAWASAYFAAASGTNWQHYALAVLDPQAQTVTLTELGKHWISLR